MDLFCSAGGLSLGVTAALAEYGLVNRIVAAVDTDSKVLDVFSKNHRAGVCVSMNLGNMVRFDLDRFGGHLRISGNPTLKSPLAEVAGTIDIVVGGPPCQGHSGFNNKTRGADYRNSLYIAATACALALGARIIIFENVPDIVRSHYKEVEIAVATLAAEGFKVETGVISADEIGWPQSRRRHFLVASKEGVVPLRRVADSYRAQAPGCAEFLSDIPKRSDWMEQVPAYSTETVKRLAYFRDNPDKFDLPLELRPDCHRGGTTYKAVYGRMRPEDPVPTLTTGFMTPGRGRFVHPLLPRTLTAGEAAFVQGFPAWFDFESCNPSRQDITKWIGDAVPLPVGFVAAMAALQPWLGEPGSARK